MIGNHVYQHIANFFLTWIRRNETWEGIGNMRQREILDQLRRLVSAPGVEGDRIANELTRWVFSGDPMIQDFRWKEDLWCRERILRKVRDAADRQGAEVSADILDDETARSYPRVKERIRNAAADMIA